MRLTSSANDVGFLHFNSHTPCGVRRTGISVVAYAGNFNSHTPCGVRLRVRLLIFLFCFHFNSHTPCGVRRGRCKCYGRRKHFNSHTPCGVRLYENFYFIARRNFNSHTPCGVRHLMAVCRKCHVADFNSHTPCGVRRYSRCREHHIQIFQLTHPMRGATIFNF